MFKTGIVFLGDVPALPGVVQAYDQVGTGTSVTSFEYCQIPYSPTSTTYMAASPPVLNIVPVSCTLETQQMEILLGDEKCFTRKEKPTAAR